MIDLALRPCDVGPRGLCNKRKLYDGLGASACKRPRRPAASASALSPSMRLVDLQILGEDGALVQEATIEEIWAPHTTRLEIVVVDEAWDSPNAALASDTHDLHEDDAATFLDLDDPVIGALGSLGPLGGTSALHSAILRETQQQQHHHHHHHHHYPQQQLPAQHPPVTRQVAGDITDSDFGNLDWLINFKVDSVFEPKKQKGRAAGSPSSFQREALAIPTTTMQGLAVTDIAGEVSISSSGSSSSSSSSSMAVVVPPSSASPRAPTPLPPVSSAAPVAAVNTNPHPQAHRYSGPGKPPFTYTELIELALKDKGKLTVKEIYQWITKHFPFYQASDERWKNSVRHNLSINPHFRKESKAPQGAGHLWVVMDNNNKAKNSWKEERIQNFLAAQISAAEAAEAAAIVAAAQANEAASSARADATSPPSPQRPPTPPSPITTGAKSQSQLNTWWSERVSLERSAEEILSGVKREVGVEFLTPMDLDGDLDTDDMKLDIKDEKGFLYGDLTAEQVIAESGLQDELAGLYLLNDMTSSINADSLFPDDLNLGGLELPLSG